MAKYTNKWTGTSYEKDRRLHRVPLSDGTFLEVWVHPEIMMRLVMMVYPLCLIVMNVTSMY